MPVSPFNDAMRALLTLPSLLFLNLSSITAAELSRDDVEKALHRAVTFFHQKVRWKGGYVWRYSGDLKLREGEGNAETSNWVQPPGTPAIGTAFLEAYQATKNKEYLQAAIDTARELLSGQVQSGGWNYQIEHDPAKRKKLSYRADRDYKQKATPGGWAHWRRRRNKGNMTNLDDDTTQASVRFLMRLDAALEMKDQVIHEAAVYALKSLLQAQYPSGGWSVSWDRLPSTPSEKEYPVLKASYPKMWLREWPNTWTGCYVLNDNLMSDMIEVMLLAWDTYKDKRYLESAKKAGDFLILAQMPEPQPSWAQQYDKNMHPVWSRKFEPPAISGGESQKILRSLMTLYRATGEKKYLKPIPPAIAWFKRSLRKDGRVARFYELKTNRPLYFYRDKERRYYLTYKDDRLPTHYGFIVSVNPDRMEKEYRQVVSGAKTKKGPGRLSSSLVSETEKVIKSMDSRGAWIEKGVIKTYKTAPKVGGH